VAKISEAKLVEKLNNELFRMVEGDQGEGFVSDAAYTESLTEYLGFVEAQRFYTREAAKKMTAFLRKYRRLAAR
jgi:hypothetical protein